MCLCQHEVLVAFGIKFTKLTSFLKGDGTGAFNMSFLSLTVKQLQLCAVSRIYFLIGVNLWAQYFFQLFPFLWIFICDSSNLSNHLCEAWPPAIPFSSHFRTMSCFVLIFKSTHPFCLIFIFLRLRGLFIVYDCYPAANGKLVVELSPITIS